MVCCLLLLSLNKFKDGQLPIAALHRLEGLWRRGDSQILQPDGLGGLSITLTRYVPCGLGHVRQLLLSVLAFNPLLLYLLNHPRLKLLLQFSAIGKAPARRGVIGVVDGGVEGGDGGSALVGVNQFTLFYLQVLVFMIE